MKEFIKKDMLYIKAYHKFNLLISLVFILSAAARMGNNFFAIYGVLFLTMISASLISYDETEQFIFYAVSIPKGREKLVSSKYISNLIVCACGIFTALLFFLAMGWIKAEGETENMCMLLSALCVVSMGIPAIMMPFNFALGVKKGRLPGMLAIGAIFGAITYLGILFDNGSVADYALLLIALGSLVLYGVSWCISLKIYKRKSF